MKNYISNETISPLEAKAEEVAATLAAMANPKRLVVMCTLLGGEKSVGELAEIVQLSPAALSQHLALLREEGIVTTRRESQTIYYRIVDHAAMRVIETLAELFCPPEMRKHA